MSQQNAAIVGSSFVRQYYQALAENKETLHKFYGERAVRTYIDDEITDGDNVRMATGQQNIKEQIGNITYEDLTLNLESPYGSVNSQPTIGGGILTTVTGLVGFYGHATRRLVQTVILQPVNGSFVVQNDMFHVLKEDASTVNSVNITKVVQPVVTEVAQQTDPAGELPYAEVIHEHIDETNEQQVAEAEGLETVYPTTISSDDMVVEEANGPESNKSWSQVAGTKPKEGAAPINHAASNVSRRPKKAPAEQAATQQTQTNGSPQSKATAPQKKNTTSIFIQGDILPELQLSELKEAFNKFGEIKNISGNKNDTKRYIHYDDPVAVDRALDVKNVIIRDQPVSIKPAKHKNSRGRGGRGRN